MKLLTYKNQILGKICRVGRRGAVAILVSLLAVHNASGVTLSRQQRQGRILEAARALLESADVSYVYGGGKLANADVCEPCNQCLRDKKPSPADRQKICPSCHACSLDCSHFVELVYDLAGLNTTYVTTKDMQGWSAKQLKQYAGLVPVQGGLRQAQPGDLLVYGGHVVILEALQANGRGDVIHATSGRAIKEPGQGIQRERMVDLAYFRGPIQRVLRHAKLDVNTP